MFPNLPKIYSHKNIVWLFSVITVIYRNSCSNFCKNKVIITGLLPQKFYWKKIRPYFTIKLRSWDPFSLPLLLRSLLIANYSFFEILHHVSKLCLVLPHNISFIRLTFSFPLRPLKPIKCQLTLVRRRRVAQINKAWKKPATTYLKCIYARKTAT